MDASSSDSQDSSQPDSQGIEELANAANAISPLRDELKELRGKFDDICAHLNVNVPTSTKAWYYISRIPSSENTTENERFWIASALYIAGSMRFAALSSKHPKANGFSLSQLLKVCNIRLVDFFEPLKSFIALLQLGKEYEEQLKQVEKNFVVMCILFQKYDKIFDSLFHSVPDVLSMTGRKETPESRIKTFGWDLFLYSKVRLMEQPDLVQAFHLLLVCVNVLLIHVPAHMRKLSFRDPQFANLSGHSASEALSNGGDDGSKKVAAADTLKYLCKVNNAIYDDVVVFYERIFIPFLEIMCKNDVLKCELGKISSDPALANSFYMHGLLDANLIRNVTSIEREYELRFYSSGDLDERLFREHSEQIGTPSRMVAQSRAYYNIKPPTNPEWEKMSTFASPLSKLPGTPGTAQTPMTSAMSAITWLKLTLADREDMPSTTLKRFFCVCPVDATLSIETRVRGLIEKLAMPFSSSSLKLVESIDSEKIGKAEKQHSPNSSNGGGDTRSNFRSDSTLSSESNSSGEGSQENDARENELEIADKDEAADSRSPGTLGESEEHRSRWATEWSQKKTLVKKMYYKLLESMLLAEEARLHTDNFATLLNHELFQKSLMACAAEIVLFVYKVSALSFPAVLRIFDVTPFDFCKLIENVVRLEQGLHRVIVRHLSKIEEGILERLAWESGSPVYTLLQSPQNLVLGTPKKPVAPPPSQAFASPVRNSKPFSASATPKVPLGSLSLDLFLRKVFLLVSIRGQNLCGNLQLPSAIFQQVWKALVHILTNEVSVICDRHIDQVLMATLYGVCRVNNLNVTFKSIIEKYSIQPQSSSRIYREVTLQDGQKGDIITFYNTIFIPAMQQFLTQLQQPTTQQQPTNNEPPTPGITSPQPVKQKITTTTTTTTTTNPFSSPIRPPPHSPRHNLYVSPMSTRVAPRSSTVVSTGSNIRSSNNNSNNNNMLSNISVNYPSSLLSSTPRSVLFSFGQSPAQDLRSINNSINSPRPAQGSLTPTGSLSSPSHARRAKRQLFEIAEEEEVEDQPKKKQAVDD